MSKGNSYRPGEEEMCGKLMEAHLERQTQGQKSQPPVQDGLGGAKAHDDRHRPYSSLWTHRTHRVHRTGQRDVQEFENVKGECPQTPAKVKWITMWRGFQCRDKGAEFSRSGGKRLPFGRVTPNGGTKLQVQSQPPYARYWTLAGSQAHQVFWQAPDATLDGALFNSADRAQCLQ